VGGDRVALGVDVFVMLGSVGPRTRKRASAGGRAGYCRENTDSAENEGENRRRRRGRQTWNVEGVKSEMSGVHTNCAGLNGRPGTPVTGLVSRHDQMVKNC
jgi:hypothetical protein